MDNADNMLIKTKPYIKTTDAVFLFETASNRYINTSLNSNQATHAFFSSLSKQHRIARPSNSMLLIALHFQFCPNFIDEALTFSAFCSFSNLFLLN